MGGRALADLNPALVAAASRAWIGTPYATHQAVRGRGCDCVGLVRGVLRDLTGAEIDLPGWDAEWHARPADPLIAAMRAHADPVSAHVLIPGHVVTWRRGDRARHVGIVAPGGGYIHAPTGGRVRHDDFVGGEILSAWALRAHPDAITGPADLDVEDCLAVVYPGPAGGAYADVTLTLTGELVARSPIMSTRRRVVDYLDPVFPNIETME